MHMQGFDHWVRMVAARTYNGSESATAPKTDRNTHPVGYFQITSTAGLTATPSSTPAPRRSPGAAAATPTHNAHHQAQATAAIAHATRMNHWRALFGVAASSSIGISVTAPTRGRGAVAGDKWKSFCADLSPK